MTIPFWFNDPSILLNKKYIFEVWPQELMKYEQKLNAISRTIIIITCLGYMLTMSYNMVIFGVLTLGLIFAFYKYKTPKVTKELLRSKEGFHMNDGAKSGYLTNPETLEKQLKKDFVSTNKKNPFSNVLLTEINDKPKRKAAPPAFNPEVYEDITKSTKRMVQNLNPEIKNTNKQLFGGLGENFELDQSMRIFNSTANTKIPNDQGAFADFLYGNMPSCKDGDDFACVKDNERYNLY